MVPGQSAITGASSSSSQEVLPMQHKLLSQGWYCLRYLCEAYEPLWYLIINNNIPLDDYCMTAMMNRSGGSNNHEQIEKQTKNNLLRCTLKSRNTEIHQGLKYFVDKATGIIGGYLNVPFCAIASQYTSPPSSASHSHMKAKCVTWG